MKLRIRDIEREGEIEVEDALPASLFPLDTPDRPEVTAPVRVKLQAESREGRAWAWVEADVRVSLQCARCLERFSLELRPCFDFEAPLAQEYLEVDDEVRQQILLALPAKALCREDCRGLCQRCGKNLNAGPCPCPPGGDSTSFGALKNIKIV